MASDISERLEESGFEVDTMLGNYKRLIRQGQFKQGWMKGREEAPLIEEAAARLEIAAEAAGDD